MSKNLAYPGKIGLGFHGKTPFEYNTDVKTKDGVAEKALKCTTEYGSEAFVNFSDENKVSGKIAGKLCIGTKYTYQSMFDDNFKFSSAFTYIPKKGFKLIWSDQFDAKKMFTNPKDGIDYTYGFTFEMNF